MPVIAEGNAPANPVDKPVTLPNAETPLPILDLDPAAAATLLSAAAAVVAGLAELFAILSVAALL